MNWKKLSSKTVYENDWLQVREDHVINPRGGENQYGHVRFKCLAVAIVPIDEEDHTWLVGQHRYTLDEYSWEVPMGGAPLAEEPLAAAKRELREETGLSAERWTEILRVHTSNSVTDESGIAYVAEQLTEGETDFDETEVLEIRRLPLVEAIRMAQSGDITDAISVAALLRVAVQRQLFVP